MKLLAVTLSLLVLALAVAGLALPAFPEIALQIPAQALPGASALLALGLVIVAALWRPARAAAPVVVAAPAPAPRPVAPPAQAVVPPVAAPAGPAPGTEAVNLLSLFQDKGRLVDFLMDDVTPYSDAQVGAAARVLHEGCRAVLLEHFGIQALRSEAEGARITVPAGYAADSYRLVGRISGEAPFSGVLVHHGWIAEWVRLPRVIAAADGRRPAIAPAEVELG